MNVVREQIRLLRATARFFGIVAVVAGFAAVLAAVPAVASEKPYIVVVNDAPPFRLVENWGGKSGYSGAYIDTILELSHRTGIPLEFRAVPFARAFQMMKTGEADMMLGPTWNIERAEYMAYLRAAFPAESKVFYLSRSALDISRYSDLKKVTIGVLLGARYFDPFDKDRSLKKVTLPRYENAFKMLDRERIDVLIIPERQGRYMMRNFGYEFRTSSFRVPGKPSFITLSHASRLLAQKDRIERAMDELKAEGYFERVMLLYLE